MVSCGKDDLIMSLNLHLLYILYQLSLYLITMNTPQVFPCSYPGCFLTFTTTAGRSRHMRSLHLSRTGQVRITIPRYLQLGSPIHRHLDSSPTSTFRSQHSPSRLHSDNDTLNTNMDMDIDYNEQPSPDTAGKTTTRYLNN